MDKKEGEGTYYYNDGITKYEGSYKNNKREGIWRDYTVKGVLKSEMSYKDDVVDGPYHTYALAEYNAVSVGSDAIHVTGQNTNGKRTGIWYYGYYNEGWVERSMYDEGVRLWHEYHDTSIDIYNPDGRSIGKKIPVNRIRKRMCRTSYLG